MPADSQAVVLRFGSVDRVLDAGLLLAWPEPIERVVVLPARDRQIEFRTPRQDWGRSDPSSSSSGSFNYGRRYISDSPRLNTAFFLTGDGNVVRLEATVIYNIEDPVRYLLSVEQIPPALERLFLTTAVAIAGSRGLDTMLVARPELAAQPDLAAMRSALRADFARELNRRLDALSAQGAGLGIRVSRVDVLAAIPAGAKEAFDSVLTAAQNAEAAIAESRTMASLKHQAAAQERDRLYADATARARELVNDAQSASASIQALAQQPDGMSNAMLLNRVYFDEIRKLWWRFSQIEAVDTRGGAHVLLPGAQQ